MRVAWLETELPLAVAWALAVFVVYMTVVLPLYRWWRWPRLSAAEAHRLSRMLRWRSTAHVALGGALLLVPGISPANLGFTVVPGRAWPPAIGLVVGAVAVAALLALRQNLAHEARGAYADGGERARRRHLLDVTVGCLGDTVVHFALPPLVAIGAFGLPPVYVAVAMVVGYGFVHVPRGVSMLGWTAVAAVAVTVYFMTTSVLLPAALITAAAITTIDAMPLLPEEPAPHPPLTVIEQP